MGNQIWSIWSSKSVTCKTEIDSLRSKLLIGFPYQFMKSWLSLTDSLPFKERSFGSVGIDLVMRFQFSKWMDTEAWRFRLKKEWNNLFLHVQFYHWSQKCDVQNRNSSPTFPFLKRNMKNYLVCDNKWCGYVRANYRSTPSVFFFFFSFFV